MKLKLIENAIDSLDIVMEYYYHSIYCEPDEEKRCDKIVITFLHNAMELFLKAILHHKKVNIFESKQDILNNLTLDEILSENINIKTIPYEKLVKEFITYFGCNKKTETVLYNLGKYRNAITHFGIDISKQKDQFYITIYETFNIILYEIYDELLKLDKYFSYNDIIDSLESWLEGSEEFQYIMCFNNPQNKIFNFVNIMDSIKNSSKFLNFLNTYEINMQFNNSECGFEYRIEFQNRTTDIEFYSRYSPFHNATILYDIYCKIILIVEHSTDKIYTYNLSKEYTWRPEKYRPWEEDIDIYCKCKLLTENNIRDHIIYILKEILLQKDHFN